MCPNAPANFIVSNILNLNFLLGIMNSKIFSYEFQQIGIFLGHAYEWKKQYIEQVRIPRLSHNNYQIARRIRYLASSISPELSDTENNRIQKVINRLSYKLYDLSKDEISVVESKSVF